MSTPLTNVTHKVFLQGNHAMTLDYGYTYSDGSFHKGVDLVAGTEDKVVAIAAGTVVASCNTISGTNKSTGTAGMGNYVIIEHTDGYRTRYQHMKKGSVLVKAGDTVKAGQVIGTIGNTGYSTGRHLHFDVSAPSKVANSYYSGQRYYVDPKPYLKGTKVLGKQVTVSTSTSTASVTNKAYTVDVATRLNVRKGPGTQYAVSKQLVNGTKVTVSEVQNGWGKIGTNQWVSMSYLK